MAARDIFTVTPTERGEAIALCTAVPLAGFRVEHVAHVPEESFGLSECSDVNLPADICVECCGGRVDLVERRATRRCELNQRRSFVIRVGHEPDQGLGIEIVGCPLHALSYEPQSPRDLRYGSRPVRDSRQHLPLCLSPSRKPGDLLATSTEHAGKVEHVRHEQRDDVGRPNRAVPETRDSLHHGGEYSLLTASRHIRNNESA
jgi:hypothetical protein